MKTVVLDTPAPAESGFRLTGWHVLASFVGFFGVVFAVNFWMMHLAMATFSGMQEETPYKNGLAYNTRLDEAKRQAELGWAVDVAVTRAADGEARAEVVARDRSGSPILDLGGVVRLERPADKARDREAPIVSAAGGRYVADLSGVIAGQWDVVVLFSEGGPTQFESRTRVVLP